MVTKPDRLRTSGVRSGPVVRSFALALAISLIALCNPLGPKISPGEFHQNPIVIAKVDIPVGSRIIPEQLAIAQFPSNVTPEGTYNTIDERLVGRVVVTSISPREPLTENRLAPVGAAGGLSSVIPEGYRAMTVKVDEVVGVSGFIMPGTLVDIVVVTTPPKNTGKDEMISKIVLQNIKVLASGQNIDKSKDSREVKQFIRAVTLQVTPEQAERLVLASRNGRLQIVTRNSIDQS